ncbi:hypothetical protein PR003_g8031 [Phytophthora rubi]|uniref:Uncharacterized protein n=1 Tax=Phytophthora rubi TaxID=129364 RepID=A0A6A4FWI1_9STRA|nr:hypothetical protein PR003_g8031 [Phytophthora rubi]
MAFQARWRELKKAGWTSKRPTGLSVDFTYLKPGKTTKGAKGEDFFVGEEALMKYLDKIDLDALRGKKQARRDGSANAARRRNSAEAGKAASVGKPVAAEHSAISPRNLDPDFEEADESSDASHESQDANQFEDNSDQPGADEESKEDPQTNDQSAEDLNQDVNYTAADEDPSNFVQFESDAENDDGDYDYQPVDTVDAGVEQLPDPPEMRYDHRLLSSLGGMENIASAVVPDAWLKEMGVNGWSGLATHTPYDYLQEPYQPRSPDAMREDYPHLYNGDSGPTSRALAAASTPLGAFFYFLQPQLWEDIAAEPNDYFEASIDERVEGQRAKQLAREL